jgi:hypothetical protein
MDWKLKKWGDAFLIIKDGRSFGYKIHFSKFLSNRENSLARLINSTIHINNQLMLEPNICVQEEVAKLVLESFEE